MGVHRSQNATVHAGVIKFWNQYWIITVGILLYMMFLTYHHWGQLGIPILRIPVIVMSFGWLCVILAAAHFNRPYIQAARNTHKVMVVVPNHNEDPKMFRLMLESIERQTYAVYVLYVVENGATDGRCRAVFDEWAGRQVAITHAIMEYNAQPSKRHAQAVAFNSELSNECDIVITVDGDAELAPDAVEKGLRPFNDDKVMAVAGLLVGKNYHHNLLTRLVDISFVSSFMNGRAAWSTFRSVAVNCGGLAFYRTWIVKQHMHEYLNQTIFGKEVNTGDDRILTGFAAMHGKTVFQESSVGYTLLPSRPRHLTKQRGRWWRSFWWGGVWLLRHPGFSPKRAIWWLVLSQYTTFVLYAAMIPLILLIDPVRNGHFPWEFFVYIAGLSYVRMARTLKIRRPDQSVKDQVLTYVLGAPFVPLMNLWLCTALQFWGLITYWNTGWNTRQNAVEVGVDPVPAE